MKRETVDSHRLYLTWKSMKNRCSNPNNRSYKYYGGRGIIVCDYWITSFQNFVKDMYHSFEEGKTLDRVNNNLGYSKDNCRWATSVEQASNQRKNVRVLYRGILYTEAELSRVTGVIRTTIQQRRNKGYSSEEIVHGKPCKKPIYKGVKYTIKDLAEQFNIKHLTLAYRLRVGWSVEEAVNYKRGKICS